MSAKSPPVPTKNALRALRQLALAGSTAIGTVGSVCGLAFVEYDVRQRIRLAEKIIENKNIIRSVSNGTGKAQVQRMFELAENGEDFGLDVARRDRRRRVREFSSMPPGPGKADDVKNAIDAISSLSRNARVSRRSSQPELHLSGSASRRDSDERSSIRHTSGEHLSPTGARRNASTDGERPPTIHRSLHSAQNVGVGAAFRAAGDHSKRLDNRPNSSVAQRIIEATQKQHKLHHHKVYGQPTSSKSGSRSNLAGCVDEWLAPEPQRQRLAEEERRHEVSRSPGRVDSAVHIHTWPSHGGVEPADISTLGSIVDAAVSDITIGQDEKQLPREEKDIKTAPEPTESTPSYTNISFLPSSFSEWPGSEGAITPKVNPSSNDHGDSVLDQVTEPETADLTRDPNWPEMLDTSRFTSAHQPSLTPAKAHIHDTNGKASPSTPFDSQLEIKHLVSQINNTLSGTPQSNRSDLHQESSQPPLQSDVSDISVEADSPDIVTLYPLDRSAEGSRRARLTAAKAASTVTQPLARGFATSPVMVSGTSDAAPSFVPCNNNESRRAYSPALDALLRGSLDAQYRGPTDSEYHAIVTAIFQTIAHGTSAKAEQFYEAALQIYAQSGTLEDWKRVDGLSQGFFDYFGRRPSAGPLKQLARILFQKCGNFEPLWLKDTASDASNYCLERAAQILFSEVSTTPLESTGQSDQQAWEYRVYHKACQYLCETWADSHNVDEIVRELRNVLRAAQYMKLPKSEHPFSTVIGSLASIGEARKACALADEMEYYHGIPPTALTRTPLLLGHAIAEDWDEVAKELERLHHRGISRMEPIAHALMFSKILQEFALQKPLMETYDFAVNALCYWGVVPVAQISAAVIPLCLEHERFDLVREWVEAMRISFPRIDSGSKVLALTLVQTWDQLRASCEEIEKGCQAIIASSDGEDQPLALKIAVRDAVKNTLRDKLLAVDQARADLDGNQVAASGYETLHDCLERAQRLGQERVNHDGVPESLAVRQVLTEAQAVARLHEMFGGDSIQIAHIPTSAPPVEHAQPSHRPLTNRLGGLQATFPQALTADKLPTRSDIQRHVDRYYSSRAKKDLPVHHLLLRYVCQRLVRQIRHDDAYELIHHIYSSPHVQGPHGLPFDLDIIQLWLQVAYLTKSMSKCLQVVWVVLQMGSEFHLSHQFLHQVKHTLMTVYKAQTEPTGDMQRMELTWIQRALEKRYTAQNGQYGLPEYRDEDGLLWRGA